VNEWVCCGLQGFCPPVQAALDLYRMLSEPGIDLRQPVRLENQLLIDNVDMDTEVGQSMLQLLQVWSLLLLHHAVLKSRKHISRSLYVHMLSCVPPEHQGAVKVWCVSDRCEHVGELLLSSWFCTGVVALIDSGS